MTDLTLPCSTLDVYLDGDLDTAGARAFEAHAETCQACAADLAIAARLDAEWSAMAVVPAPAGLAEAAIQRAAALHLARRGQPDRAPRPAARRARPQWARVAVLGTLLVALTATAVWTLRGADSDTPLQASAEPKPPAPMPPAAAPGLDTPRVLDTPDAPVEADPAPPPSVSRLAPRRSQRPSPRPSGPPPQAAAAAFTPAPLPAPDLAGLPAPPADSVAQARDDLLLALSLVADAQQRARSAVTTELERASSAIATTPAF